MKIEKRLEELGLVLPEPIKIPAGVEISFSWVHTFGNRVYISGHGALNPDGTPAAPFGSVGKEVSLEEGYNSARKAGLAMLGSLKQELSNLDKIEGWLKVRGYVNAAPDVVKTTNVVNGFSDLILEVFGPETGKHARIAIGVAALPLGLPVVIEAEVAIAL